jgi:hypothetical protein
MTKHPPFKRVFQIVDLWLFGLLKIKKPLQFRYKFLQELQLLTQTSEKVKGIDYSSIACIPLIRGVYSYLFDCLTLRTNTETQKNYITKQQSL